MARSVGGSSGYSYGGASNSSGDYDDELDEELEKSPSTYFEYAAAAVGTGSAAGGGASTPPPLRDDLADILIPNSFNPVRKHHDDHGISPLESNSGERSPSQEHSQRYQEYYDVLELANNRLSQTTKPASRLDSDGAVILDDDDDDYEYEKKRKSKKKKKKDKKEKRKQQKQEEENEDVDMDGRRRSSVFQTVFQPAHFHAHSNARRGSVSSEAEIRSALEKPKHTDSFADEENVLDPNDEAPGPISWSPAALVNASRSKQSGGKTNQQGFYAQVGGSSSTTRKTTGLGGWVQNLMQPKRSDKELPKDYNLNSIGRSDSMMTVSASSPHSRESSASTSKPKKKKRSKYGKLARHESIDWGDESALGDHDEEEEESVVSRQESSEIEMKVVDSCSFSDINEANENWNANTDYVEKLVWYRDRRRLGIIGTLVVVFLAGCSALYFSGGNEQTGNPKEADTFDATIKENIPDSNHVKEDDPIYPLPPPPPIYHSVLQGGFDGTSLKPLSADDFKNIIEKITPDADILSNSETPQAKAMAWSLEERTKYNIEVPVRVGVRYALATLYYATNGDKWLNNTNWKSGHECLWNGVYCDLDANNIVSVTILNLVTNNLDGSIPEEIGYIESLQRIELGSNQLVGPIPQTFSRLYELRTLSVSDNQLTGEIGANIDGLTKLTNLDLASNRFRGHVPHGLGGIPTLSYVRLSNNRFTGAFPTSFISLNNLHTLLIDNNAIGGTLPALIGMMKTLVNLRLHKNDFYGDLPNFSDAILLETAHFDDNFFKGPLPQFGSQRLRELYLDKNSLTGAIPISYGGHPKLQILSARNNDLSSTIPASLASATNLGVLDLSYNKLSGELSQNLSQLTQLRQLYLNNNRLQGSFPAWLGSMKNLEIAHFNNNLFSGDLQLGYEFENLDYLTEFTIEFNQISGIVPEDVCDLLLDVLTADCWGNPAALDCPCCTKCF